MKNFLIPILIIVMGLLTFFAYSSSQHSDTIQADATTTKERSITNRLDYNSDSGADSLNDTFDDQITILAFGDSLTAGYGLAASDSFPSQLERALEERGYDIRMINAGVSGDTTAGGRERIAWSLQDTPDLVLLALGANDGLRGVNPSNTRDNLDAILKELSDRNINTLLIGMLAPPNLGPLYSRRFNKIFPDLAEKYDVPLYPFFLEDVVMKPMLNQSDGIHPNADGVSIMVGNILDHVIRALPEQE